MEAKHSPLNPYLGLEGEKRLERALLLGKRLGKQTRKNFKVREESLRRRFTV